MVRAIHSVSLYMPARSKKIGPDAWYGKTMSDVDSWIYRLSTADVAELDDGLARTSGKSMDRISRTDFRLDGLSRALGEIRSAVASGRGFALIRGLPVCRYTKAEVMTMYWALGLHLGEPVPQNAKGHLLGHVIDLGHDPSNPLTRIYTTNYRQPYHTDSCDVVGLLCLRTARSGGLTSFSSSTTIHNEMMDTRPDLVDVLHRPYIYDRKGEIPAGQHAYYAIPVFHDFAGYLTTFYARDFIETALRHPEVPRLSELQTAALDLFDSLARRADIRLEVGLEPGDILLLHNHQIVHSRTAYTDHPEPERKRPLLRLWLCPPHPRPLPPVFEERYGDLNSRSRGGIRASGVVPSIPLVPE